MSEDDRGRQAKSPEEIPAKGLRDVFWRVVSEVVKDRVTLIAAGVTYYLLLALFPAIGAVVSLYGFVADPSTIIDQVRFIAYVLPPGSFDLILGQLDAVIAQKNSTLSLGFIGGLLISLWSANSGFQALFEAMNIAYGEREKRSLARIYFTSFVFTMGAMVIAIAFVTTLGLVPALLAYLWMDRWAETLVNITRWPILLLLVATGISTLYRFGPSRQPAKLRWLSWGAIFSTVLWVAASIMFTFYLSHFANYNATYGALGALIGLMGWMWISVIILIVGAEINSELEHQTMQDSTTGPPVPMGERGAFVADTIGEAID